MDWTYIKEKIIEGILSGGLLIGAYKAYKAGFLPAFKFLRRQLNVVDKIEEMAIDVQLIKSRQEATIHEIPYPMYECSPDGNCIATNRAWNELTGLSNEDARGNGWVKIISEKDSVRIWRAWENFVEDGTNFNEDFEQVNNKTKLPYPVNATATKEFDKDGKIITIIGSVVKK
jgi:PAS domain S-box-containing protein